MSEYQAFVFDFPSRCRELLEALEPQAKNVSREVTFLIAIGSAGLEAGIRCGAGPITPEGGGSSHSFLFDLQE